MSEKRFYLTENGIKDREYEFSLLSEDELVDIINELAEENIGQQATIHELRNENIILKNQIEDLRVSLFILNKELERQMQRSDLDE